MREIHPDFYIHLKSYDDELINNFIALRNYILELEPKANEMLYHTHALTAVFTTSSKLSDAFCMIPIYTNHFNLGFNKGTLLDDPHNLLRGTGKLIRHIPIKSEGDFRNLKVKSLILEAIEISKSDRNPKNYLKGEIISKIKN